MPKPRPISETASEHAATGMDTAVRSQILKALRGVSNAELIDGFL